jgi:hypothetical protein
MVRCANGQGWNRELVVFALVVTSSVIAVVLGFEGLKCNRYAEASLTHCDDANRFGETVVNIMYADEDDHLHIGFIETDIPCSSISMEDTVRICYPLRNPGRYRYDATRVLFRDPDYATYVAVYGLVVLTASAVYILAFLGTAIFRPCPAPSFPYFPYFQDVHYVQDVPGVPGVPGGYLPPTLH